MADHHEKYSSLSNEKRLPIHIVAQNIGQFLCRKDFDNMRLTCKEVNHVTKQMDRPWPQKDLEVGKTSIQSIGFSPNGSKLVCRDRSGNFQVWDRSHGKQIAWDGCIRSACLGNIICSPDNRYIAFDGSNKKIKVCSISDGSYVKSLEGHEGACTSLSFHCSGRILASGSTDSTVRLWDLNTGTCQQILRRHRGFVYSVTFSSEGQFLASAGSDRIIRVWNPFSTNIDGDSLQLRGHSMVVVGLSFSPSNNSLLASVSLDMTLRLWDVTNQCCMQCLRHDSEILNVCFSPNGSRLAAGQCDDLISVWNMESTIKEAVLPGRLLSFAPDGQVLATVGREGFVKLQRI